MNYPFYFGGGKHNSYYFETNNGVHYEIKFKETPYLFKNFPKEISKYVFEFAILVEYNPTSKMPPEDKKIGATVVAVFLDFYSKYDNPISIYICDSSDGKEFIRKRKFDQWFAEFNNFNFVKVDEVIADKENNKFPISLIISKSNPNRTAIIDAFIEIAINNAK